MIYSGPILHQSSCVSDNLIHHFLLFLRARDHPRLCVWKGPHDLCGHPVMKTHSWSSSSEFLSGSTFSTFVLLISIYHVIGISF